MHIIIGLITAVASLLYALERLGVDVGWINPWAWKRKRKWLKKYHANPAHNLTSPLESIALLLTALAKIDGDLSTEEKNELLKIFEEDFHQTPTEASALLSSSVYLLGLDHDVFNNPIRALESSIGSFTARQKESSLALLYRLASVGGQVTPTQDIFIEKISSVLMPKDTHTQDWH